MKTKRLLEKISDLLSPKMRRKKKEIAELEKLCEKLKEKELELEEKRKTAEDGEKAAKLAKKISLLRVQREKGQQLLAETREAVGE